MLRGGGSVAGGFLSTTQAKAAQLDATAMPLYTAIGTEEGLYSLLHGRFTPRQRLGHGNGGGIIHIRSNSEIRE
jgi:hypothetical protein